MTHRIRQQANSHRFCVQPVTGILYPNSAQRASLLIFIPQQARHHKTRLGCRLNAGGAEWAERHGCRESAARTWMSVQRGPTERRRSEGTRRSRAQPGADPWLLGVFSSNPPMNSLDVRTNQTISVPSNSGDADHTSLLAIARVQPLRRRLTRCDRQQAHAYRPPVFIRSAPPHGTAPHSPPDQSRHRPQNLGRRTARQVRRSVHPAQPRRLGHRPDGRRETPA